MNTVESVVTSALIELLDMPPDSLITTETRLQEDLGIDSGLLLELFVTLEERLPEIVIDLGELKPQEFSSVGSLTALIESGIKKGVAA